MKILRMVFIILLVLMYFSQWMTIAHQSIALSTRRIPEQRLIELLEQSQINERRLTALAAQNRELAARTQAILDRVIPVPMITRCYQPDEPLVLYEAVPVKAPAKKGRRQ